MAAVAVVTHPLVRRHLEDARRNILNEIEGLKAALGQVEEMLKTSAQPAPATAQQPEGQLVSAGS